MHRILESNLDLLVQSGFLYVPLLMDPTVEEELEAFPQARAMESDIVQVLPQSVVEVNGRYYVRTLNLNSLPDSYRSVYAAGFDRLRADVLRRYYHMPLSSVSVDAKLKIILFQILPHFVKLHRGLKKKSSLDEEEILDFISQNVEVPSKYLDLAGRYVNVESLRKAVEDLDGYEPISGTPRDGIIAAGALNAWLGKVLESKIIMSEKTRLLQILKERTQFIQTQRRHMAVLLYIAEKGALEINGFGFFRRGSSEHYIIYMRTGEYALLDYYDHIYLFPDCRVAVDTSGPLRPLVIDTYKHPLLPDYDSWQKICVRRFYVPETEFSAKNVIRALEEGISALFYGYNNRHHNGYYKLETKVRHIRTLDFEDYIVTNDHPKIQSGDVEIKNGFE